MLTVFLHDLTPAQTAAALTHGLELRFLQFFIYCITAELRHRQRLRFFAVLVYLITAELTHGWSCAFLQF